MPDWTRVAQPQDDGYDLTVIAACQPQWRKRIASTPVTMCDGCTDVVQDATQSWEADLSQAWADGQTAFLQQWPAGYRALVGFLDEYRGYRKYPPPVHGCESDHVVSDHAHIVCVSSDEFSGTAQGIYHEVGHLRLEALGVGIEQHDGRLLLNPAAELFPSPVRNDIPRPMSAVLHGTYAWCLFTDNDRWNHAQGLVDRRLFDLLAQRNFPKIANGIRTLQQSARTTAEGTAFLTGLYAWAESILMRQPPLNISVT